MLLLALVGSCAAFAPAQRASSAPTQHAHLAERTAPPPSALPTRRRGVALRGGGDDDGDDDDAAMASFLRGKMAEEKAAPNAVANFFSKLGKGLDDFVDDAMDRKLGNGDKFYGKRKSNFYGAGDEGKRAFEGDSSEDYAGPRTGGYFQLDSEGRPVSRRGKRLD